VYLRITMLSGIAVSSEAPYVIPEVVGCVGHFTRRL
jgi:hypothetical protein